MPTKLTDPPRNAVLFIRVTDQEKALIERAAKSLAQRPTSWSRNMLLYAAELVLADESLTNHSPLTTNHNGECDDHRHEETTCDCEAEDCEARGESEVRVDEE